MDEHYSGDFKTEHAVAVSLAVSSACLGFLWLAAAGYRFVSTTFRSAWNTQPGGRLMRASMLIGVPVYAALLCAVSIPLKWHYWSLVVARTTRVLNLLASLRTQSERAVGCGGASVD